MAGDKDIELQWMRPAQQDRSRDTQDRIVEATLRLLAKGRSFHEISVSELAKEADASVGAFYNRFRDKDALLHVLQIELYKEGEATAAATLVPERWKGVPLASLVRAFVTLSVTSYRQQQGLRRALLIAMCNEEQFRERAAALSKRTCDGLADVIAARSPKLNKRTLRTAIDVCHRIVYGVLDQNLVFGDLPPAGHTLADSALVEELTTACVAYLETRL